MSAASPPCLVVSPSERWATPGPDFCRKRNGRRVRSQVYRTLNRAQDPEEELGALSRQLDEAYMHTAHNLPHNAAVSIGQEDGRDVPILTGLDKLPEPPSLVALGLVLNMVVVWNTRYVDAAVRHLQAKGVEVRPEDVARLTPLSFQHINFHGRDYFNLDERVDRGALRPLRDPSQENDLGLW